MVGVVTTLVVDMAFLVQVLLRLPSPKHKSHVSFSFRTRDCMSQANTNDELPERLIGAVRVSHLELSSAIVPELPTESP